MNTSGKLSKQWMSVCELLDAFKLVGSQGWALFALSFVLAVHISCQPGEGGEGEPKDDNC